MKRSKKILTAALAVSMIGCAVTGACVLTGCKSENYEKNLALHLTFDEGSGNKVKDASGNVTKDATVSYVYSNAQYIPSRDPEWRTRGVKGGSLLFDGYSSSISYSGEQICVSGNAITVSAYIAPRMFESCNTLDDIEKRETKQLTSVVSQYYKSATRNDGFILGYFRFGELSFQVGTGDNWVQVWSGNKRLNKYEWNYVAGVFDGDNGVATLYLNGEEVGRTEFDAGSRVSKPTDTYMFIGANGTEQQYGRVSGLLDDICIYNTALPASYIRKTHEENPLPEIPFEDIWMMKDLLKDDVYKTQYHGGPSQMWMNEPHAPVYYNGVYHIFHQFNMAGPFFRQLCWGHFTSTDMVNWTPRKEVITPMPDSVCPDGVWSGGAIKDVNGVPVLFFTAGDRGFESKGLYSHQNIGYAYPKDITDPYLTEWIVGDELAIEQVAGQGAANEFRDAHCWVEDGVWYMTVCSANNGQGCALLYQSDMLEVDYATGDVDMNWVYRGILYQLPAEEWKIKYGLSWELPVLLPIENEAGTVKKHILIISPAPAGMADNNIFYFLGTFNKKTGKFIPDPGYTLPRRLDYGPNVFTGPSAMIDDKTGNVCIFSLSQDYRSQAEVISAGWVCSMGIVRNLWLSDDGSYVKINAVSAVRENYTTPIATQTNLTVAEANEILNANTADMVYLSLIFTGITEETEYVTVNVKSGNGGADNTDFTYDVRNRRYVSHTLNRGAQDSKGESDSMTETFGLDNGKLVMEIYIDRSLMEAFFNSDIAISMRSYAKPSSTAISVSVTGENAGSVMISELKLCSVRSIY